MKKSVVFIIAGIIVVISFFLVDNDSNSTRKLVSYNGNNLRISIDGVSSNTLPTSGSYYLASYDCKNTNTKLSWDKDNYKLEVSNGTKKAGVSCNLEFSSKPLLSQMEVGSYVKYVGDNGCEGNLCEGYNANYVDETDMGYCNNSLYKFNTKGWRIAYVENGSAYLISAGSPECMCTNSSGNASTSGCVDYSTWTTHGSNMDKLSVKYCNNDFSNHGLCDNTTAWGFAGTNFKKITNYNLHSDCGIDVFACGYGNDLFSIGSYYWINLEYSGYSGYRWLVYREHNKRTAELNGVRPVLYLDSSVVVIGGSGTYDDPYLIDNNYFDVGEDIGYVNANNVSNVQLFLNTIDEDVIKMCVSVDTSECSNYIDFSNTYTLDWSSEEDGEKTIYVYYKNSDDKIVASLSKTVIIDTVAPTENSATINDDSDGLVRTLTLSSAGADYMCVSNTSNSSSDCTKWVDYQSTYGWTIEEGTGTKNIYVFFKDNANNIVGPYSVSTTCTTNCEHKYFMDVYNDDFIYLIRNDGATAKVFTRGTNVDWYTVGSQEMNVCGASNIVELNSYFWCIGIDNNAYYKVNYGDNWNKVDISSYVDTSSYTYSIYVVSQNAYIIRSDGKINFLSSSGLESTSWEYGSSKNMAVCSGYSSNRIICLGQDGYYYYRTAYNTTDDYLGGSIIKLDSRTNTNSWIDMYGNYRTDIIETDGTNLYNTHVPYTGGSVTWYTSSIPGGGIRTCASNGYSLSGSYNNYCLGNDNYLYYKSYDATEWTKTAVNVG